MTSVTYSALEMALHGAGPDEIKFSTQSIYATYVFVHMNKRAQRVMKNFV